MASFNNITIVGNLGRDPELRYTPNGTPVTQFSMATNDNYRRGGDDVQVTTWFRVTVFGRQAEAVSQYMVKGRQCCVIGRLRAEEWTDRDGKVRTTLEVTADHVKFLGGNPQESREHRDDMDQDAKAGRGHTNQQPETVDDDIPF